MGKMIEEMIIMRDGRPTDMFRTVNVYICSAWKTISEDVREVLTYEDLLGSPQRGRFVTEWSNQMC